MFGECSFFPLSLDLYIYQEIACSSFSEIILSLSLSLHIYFNFAFSLSLSLLLFTYTLHEYGYILTLPTHTLFPFVLTIFLLLGSKLVKFLGEFPYSLSEVMRKLEALDEEGEVLGSGGVGCVYKLTMDDSATYAVKRIERKFEGSGEILEREVDILGSIKHINLVKLRGYCRLPPSSRFLIYDYLALGSLDQFLHGEHLHCLTHIIMYLVPSLSLSYSNRWARSGIKLECTVEDSLGFCEGICILAP